MMRGNELLTAAKVPDPSRAPTMNATRSEYGLICPAVSSPARAARRRIICSERRFLLQASRAQACPEDALAHAV